MPKGEIVGMFIGKSPCLSLMAITTSYRKEQHRKTTQAAYRLFIDGKITQEGEAREEKRQ
jgi:hypothetical protein